MKIAIVSTYFPPVAGGEGIVAYHQAKELAKNNEVHVYTSDRRDGRKLKSEEIVNNIKVHRLNTWFRGGFHFVIYPSLTNKLLKGNFDIIHFHSFGILQHDLAVIKINKKCPKTILVNTPHHPSFSFKYKFPKNLLVNFVKWLETNLVHPKYDLVIKINPSQDSWMTNWGVKKNKIKFISNGLSEEDFDISKGKKLLKKYNLEEKFILLYLGRIQKYKGLDQIINILPYLASIKKNIVFLCVGKDSGDKKRLINLSSKLGLKNRVIFLGEVLDNEKREIISLSDIVVLPSKIEGFGLILLEGMAQNKPVVSTKTEGGNFLIKEGINGYTYSFGKLKELSEILGLLIKNSNLRKKIGDNGRGFAKKFLWNKIVKELEKIYSYELNKNG